MENIKNVLLKVLRNKINPEELIKDLSTYGIELNIYNERRYNVATNADHLYNHLYHEFYSGAFKSLYPDYFKLNKLDKDEVYKACNLIGNTYSVDFKLSPSGNDVEIYIYYTESKEILLVEHLRHSFGFTREYFVPFVLDEIQPAIKDMVMRIEAGERTFTDVETIINNL